MSPSENRKPVRTPRLVGWGKMKQTLRVFPGGDPYFDLLNNEGDLLDVAVPQKRESAREFASRVALDYEYAAGAPLPAGCKLVFSEIAG